MVRVVPAGSLKSACFEVRDGNRILRTCESDAGVELLWLLSQLDQVLLVRLGQVVQPLQGVEPASLWHSLNHTQVQMSGLISTATPCCSIKNPRGSRQHSSLGHRDAEMTGSSGFKARESIGWEA